MVWRAHEEIVEISNSYLHQMKMSVYWIHLYYFYLSSQLSGLDKFAGSDERV